MKALGPGTSRGLGWERIRERGSMELKGRRRRTALSAMGEPGSSLLVSSISVVV